MKTDFIDTLFSDYGEKHLCKDCEYYERIEGYGYDISDHDSCNRKVKVSGNFVTGFKDRIYPKSCIRNYRGRCPHWTWNKKRSHVQRACEVAKGICNMTERDYGKCRT